MKIADRLSEQLLTLPGNFKVTLANVLLAGTLIYVIIYSIALYLVGFGGPYAGAYHACAFVTSFLLIALASRSAREKAILIVSVIPFVFAFIFGMAVAGVYLHSTGTPHGIILSDGKEVRGRIIRAGERGVLFVVPREKGISFIKWDQVKFISKPL